MYMTISRLIAAKTLPVDFGTEFAPSSVSITDSQPLSSCRWMVRCSGQTQGCSSTSELVESASWTTGSDCYHLQNSRTTTLSTIPYQWDPSRWTTPTILQCNSRLPTSLVSDHKCRQTGGWHAYQRLTVFFGKAKLWLWSGKQCTPAAKRWLLQFQTKYGYRPGTSEHLCLQRCLITSTQDRIW